MNRTFPLPRLVVSKCLGFDHCRYDGSIIPDRVVDALRPHAEFLPVCPELEIGLGAPRRPVRLIRTAQGVRLFQPDTGLDHTDKMRAFAEKFLSGLPPVDGFILKNRSPSCGIKDAKVYGPQDKSPVLGRQPGMFGLAVVERFPDLPVEEEGRLTNQNLREHFFTVVFALADLREVEQTGRMQHLVDFHARHKFLLMAQSQRRLKELGQVVANPERRPFSRVMATYKAGFRAALAQPPRRPAVVNVLLHALGYVSEGLSKAEKAHFLDLLAQYREGRLPLSAPVSVLRSWIARFNPPYLAQQSFFHPFPDALISLKDSGKD